MLRKKRKKNINVQRVTVIYYSTPRIPNLSSNSLALAHSHSPFLLITIIGCKICVEYLNIETFSIQTPIKVHFPLFLYVGWGLTSLGLSFLVCKTGTASMALAAWENWFYCGACEDYCTQGHVIRN